MINKIKREIKTIQQELYIKLDPSKVMYFNQLYDMLDNLREDEITVDEKIEQELQSAEECIDDYEYTHNRNYIEMAYDKSIHAAMRIDMALNDGHEVQDMKGWVNDLQYRIKQYR